MAELRGLERRGNAADGDHKKAPPKAGPGWEAGLQSGLGRRAQRSGDALAQLAAPTEGSSRAEQGQRARNNFWFWCAKDHLD